MTTTTPYLRYKNISLKVVPGVWEEFRFGIDKECWEEVTWLAPEPSNPNSSFKVTLCLDLNPHIKGPNVVKLGSINKIQLLVGNKQYYAELIAMGDIQIAKTGGVKRSICRKDDHTQTKKYPLKIF